MPIPTRTLASLIVGINDFDEVADAFLVISEHIMERASRDTLDDAQRVRVTEITERLLNELATAPLRRPASTPVDLSEEPSRVHHCSACGQNCVISLTHHDETRLNRAELCCSNCGSFIALWDGEHWIQKV